MRGVPLKAVQELMGHTTMKMTMRYAHLSPDIHQDAVATLDQPAQRQHSGSTVVGEVFSLADAAKTIKKPGT
jgi:site-specific recombinase XerD